MSHFCSWIAGFVDGEGCFSITTGSRVVCKLCVQTRADDAEVLQRIKEQVGAGTIMWLDPPSAKARGINPQVRWEVYRKADCLTLIDFFDKFPLQAKKAKDYALWKEAVLLHAQVQHKPANNKHLLRQIEELKMQLQKGRAYVA